MHVWQLTVNDDIKSIALHLSSIAVQCCAAVKAIFICIFYAGCKGQMFFKQKTGTEGFFYAVCF